VKVSFLGLDADAEETSRGSITWDGKAFMLDPAGDALLKDILADKVLANFGANDEKMIGSGDDPEAWMRGLQMKYKSAYLRATEPQ
jgi:hypothetical protein